MEAGVQPFPGSPVFKRDEHDAAWVQRCMDGDLHAFDHLLSRYERPLYNAAYRILHHREDARDVVQTAFMHAYEHRDRFDPAQRFFSWIYRIVVNETLNVSASRRRTEPLPETLVEQRDAPEDAAAQDELDSRMQSALMALKLDYRTVLVLKHLQGFSYDEIAGILECPVKTVKSRLFTARQALRDVLHERGLLQ